MKKQSVPRQTRYTRCFLAIVALPYLPVLLGIYWLIELALVEDPKDREGPRFMFEGWKKWLLMKN